MRCARLRRSVTFALLCMVFCVAAVAQSSPYKPGSPVLMWKVSSKTNSAYVLGSVHIGDKSMYPLPAVIEDAFNSAKILIVEVDMTKVDPMQLQQLMAANALYPEGDDLFQHIKPETRDKLMAFLNTYGLPPDAISRFKPWALGITIATLPMMRAGLDLKNGLDMYFMNKAAGKRIEQLEDAEWQIKLLASEITAQNADKYINSCLKQAEDMDQDTKKLSRLWSEGSAEKIDELVSKTTADEKELSRRLREDRNPHMIDRLEQCLQRGEACFMVVGAAHVVGREGIVNEIKARGYRVEQAVVQVSTTRGDIAK